MTTLTITEQGQVTFQSDVLDHLGIRPGDKIRLDLLPNGRAELTADQSQGSWDALQNFFAGKTNGKRLSIEDLNEAISDAAAAAVQAGLTKG
ncbi:MULTISPECIES: AbrB/MazE/SpoVT family DNA-binding domain-containing protein [unclassified Methylobacterium]|uniref:AbrB/MazE/SpoVT family DNA-binding domain-containing protein n=1 Tax=unclassified Methylobacterium TaxID=2615210 RepID=UPI001FBAFCA3|nr:MULTISPECIES: AbrB/MazE/SpoVT family DNA-binding domain-containing protein [unclassified Methylobacterium]MCJ2021153.1 AbrB/MazE/SpoVT family DNA-binding domain-containing protein [Methylobacterium sp. E-065]